MTDSVHTISSIVAPDQLTEVGPLVSGAWSRPDDELGREIRGSLLIDTGAFGAMIDLELERHLAERLPVSDTRRNIV
jgi:hypothetical protein